MMHTRRSFLKSSTLALCGAAAPGPGIFAVERNPVVPTIYTAFSTLDPFLNRNEQKIREGIEQFFGQYGVKVRTEPMPELPQRSARRRLEEFIKFRFDHLHSFGAYFMSPMEVGMMSSYQFLPRQWKEITDLVTTLEKQELRQTEESRRLLRPIQQILAQCDPELYAQNIELGIAFTEFEQKTGMTSKEYFKHIIDAMHMPSYDRTYLTDVWDLIDTSDYCTIYGIAEIPKARTFITLMQDATPLKEKFPRILAYPGGEDRLRMLTTVTIAAHEMGHLFGLWHPEDGILDGRQSVEDLLEDKTPNLMATFYEIEDFPSPTPHHPFALGLSAYQVKVVQNYLSQGIVYQLHAKHDFDGIALRRDPLFRDITHGLL